jgi:FxsC-like protein
MVTSRHGRGAKVQRWGEVAPMVLGLDVRPYFFLSYARTPKRDPTDREDPDRWVHKLYKDLCGAILQMTNARPEEAGFMDRENRLGTEWSPELATALAMCRVFVPLYSPRYFESDNCGKEWFAFARRGVNQNARGEQTVPAIVPALWTRLDREAIPGIAQSIQYDHVDLGQRYRAEGFYGIMKLQNYRADYQRAVHRLAQRIVEVANQTVFSEEQLADFDSLQSAFGPASARRTNNGQLQIAVLAHDRSTLPPGRAYRYYGDTPRTWSPYQPDYPQPLADYARELARKCMDCQPVVGAFADDAASWSSNGHPVPPSLCLVDAWVAVSEPHLHLLRLLDQLEQPWVSILVPWNSQDTGMSDAEQDLRDKLSKLLGRRLDGVPRRCRMAATGIPTLQEFGQLLPMMTMIMGKRFRKAVPAYPPAGPPIERPRLRRTEPEESGGTR